jgi:hypothetical protein
VKDPSPLAKEVIARGDISSYWHASAVTTKFSRSQNTKPKPKNALQKKIFKKFQNIKGETMWSKKYDFCKNCGTNKKKHRGKGLCIICYPHFHHLKNKTNLEYMIKKRYRSMIKRSKQRGWKICSFKDFKEFALKSEEFKRLREAWISSGLDQKLVPSVDRIDNEKGYELENIQFLTMVENVKKGHIEAPKGKKVLLVKGDEILLFDSQEEASRYLGLSKTAVCMALKNNGRVQGWKPHRIE